jgi:peptide/nickel transport system substrate-binding protein/oligopeptide transport system substrate-binding protein
MADDVFYCLTRFCSADAYQSFLLLDSLKGAKEYNQGKADNVTGLKIIDNYAIQIELLRPERFFVNRISTAWISIFPREADKKEFSEKMGLTMAVGTGPYMLESMTENEIVLKKNDNYWNKENEPQLDKIIYRVIKNDQARFVHLQRGNIDLMVLPSTLFSAAFNKDGTLKKEIEKDYKVKVAATYNTHFIGINMKLVPDANLRRAIFWGTNRKEMIENILYGYADQTGGTVPPGMNGYKPPFGEALYDPEKAKMYLKKSSYKGQPLEMLVHDIGNSEQIGQIFQAQMAKIGVRVTLKKLDFNSVINQMVKGKCQLFSMFMEYVFSSPEPVLINIFSTSKIPVPNFFQFSNNSVDTMLNSLYEMKDEKESVAYCAKIEAKIMEDAPAIFLYRQKYVILYPRGMEGLEVSGNNHYFLEKIRIKN